MKNRIYVIFLILWATIIADAQSLKPISYQGMLVDSSGKLVKDDAYYFKFKIYKDSTGSSLLWESADSILIKTTEGGFAYDLGSYISLPDSLNNYPRLWLGVITEMPDAKEEIISLPYDNSDLKEIKGEYNEEDSLASDKGDEPILLDPKFIKSPRAKPPADRVRHTEAEDPEFFVLLKSGLDLNGRYKVQFLDLTAKTDVKTGMSGALEFQENPNRDILTKGIGVEYMLGRSQRDFEGNFSFISLYFFLKLRVFSREPAPDLPFFVGKLGYNLLTGDENFRGSGPYKVELDGGLNWGLGFGYNFDNKVICDMVYQVNNGGASLGGSDVKIQYTRFCLSVGFILNPLGRNK